MSRTPVLVTPGLPQVNLLPAEIRAARTLGVVKRWMVLAVGVSALTVGVGTAVAHLQHSAATSQLAEVNADTARLLAEQQPFIDVTSVRSEMETVAAARDSALSGEVLWSSYLDAFAGATPEGVLVSELDWRGAAPVVPLVASTDPLVSSGLGAISFTAVARDVPDVAAWADALEAVPGFDDARIDTVRLADVPGTSGYQVSGTVQVDAAALSHRFAPQTGGTP